MLFLYLCTMRVRITYDGPFYVLSKRTTILWFIPWWEIVAMSVDLEYIEKEYMKLVGTGDHELKNLLKLIVNEKYGEKN
jgi:hypothetical protein